MRWLWRQLAITTNWPVFVAVMIVSLLGIISVRAHASELQKQADSAFTTEAQLRAAQEAQAEAQKQVLFVGMGLGCMFVMQLMSYQAIGRYAWAFYLLSMLLLLYTILPKMPTNRGLFSVVKVHEARLWINFGVLNFQPAELTKVAACMVLARYLRFRSNYRTLWGLLWPFALVVVPLGLILVQPDLGSGLVFIPMLFIMLFVAGAKIRHLLAILGIGAVLATMAWFSGPKDKTGMSRDLPLLRHLPALVKGYQRDRVRALFSKDKAVLKDVKYQQDQAIVAFGSGGVAGRGAGNVPAGRYVPEAHNDMIFALIGEQFGFIGTTVLLISFLVLFATGIEIASATREPFGRLVAVGIVALLAGQTFLNLMVTVGLMPVTGVTLPFVSYGGSSLLASFISAGLLLNIGQNRPLVIAKEAFEFGD